MFYINRDSIECNLSEYRFVYATILGKLLQCKGSSDLEFALYYGLLMKTIEHRSKASRAKIKTKAKECMNRRVSTFKYEQTESFLKLLEGINTDTSLVSAAKALLEDSHEADTIKDILQRLMKLDEIQDKQLFKKQFESLRKELATRLSKLTGRTINLGNGLSAEHILFVMMNYATPLQFR